MKKFNVVFFASDSFALPVMKALKKEMQIKLVVTKNDKTSGRGQKLTPNPIKIAAQKSKLSLLETDKLSQIEVKKIEQVNAEVYLVVALGLMLPKSLFVSPKGIRTINVHPSLLPKYRGPSPIETAILSGDKYTGVSIIVIDEQMDHGPIIAQEREIIDDEYDDFISLSQRLEKRAANLLIKVLPGYIEGKIKPSPQKHNQATYCQMIKKDDGRINFTQDALAVLRHIRALVHWPGSFTTWKEKNKTIKIIEARLQKTLPEPPLTAGLIFRTESGKPAVVCGKEAIIIESLQLEGKKPTNAVSFVNGYPDFIGSNLC